MTEAEKKYPNGPPSLMHWQNPLDRNLVEAGWGKTWMYHPSAPSGSMMVYLTHIGYLFAFYGDPEG